MIIASGVRQQPDGTEGKVIVLGVTEGNIERMKKGQPMHISAETHPGWPMGDTTLLIIHGETEKAIEELFRENGLIGPDTNVINVATDH